MFSVAVAGSCCVMLAVLDVAAVVDEIGRVAAAVSADVVVFVVGNLAAAVGRGQERYPGLGYGPWSLHVADVEPPMAEALAV